MKSIAITKKLILLATSLLFFLANLFAEDNGDFNATNGPNVRVVKHGDGARTIFTRTPNALILTKRKYSAQGTLILITIYRVDKNGNPLACKIYDGKKNILYKVSYGYRKSDAKLVEERMFDARVKREDPNTGNEMPIQRICYVYDANGNRSRPIVINLLPGKTYEEVFGEAYSAPETNPFKN